MKVDFVRFKASDDVELQGWLTESDSDLAVLHVHGKSGNGYENSFLDNLREMYNELGVSFFSIDTRGRGIISDFRQKDGSKRAGSCYEIFEECEYDIEGALEFLKSRGKKRFILQGHSLGCTKLVYFVTKNSQFSIEKLILLAPTDMCGWAEVNDLDGKLMLRAKELVAEGKRDELVGAKCWVDKEPLSAQTYLSICEIGGNADIYGQRKEGSMLERISLPTLIVYGTRDIGITKIEGSIANWVERVEKFKNNRIRIAIIDGANHGYREKEQQVVDAVKGFLI